MASIDERVVAMSFENSRFEANVATTMRTLGKLDAAIANIGKSNGLASIEASANKVTLVGPMSALDKLRQKLGLTTAGTTFTDMEKAADKVALTGPMSALDKLKQKLGLTNAGTTFTDMEKASDKVGLTGPLTALDKLKQKLGFTNAGTTFTDIERASDKVTLTGPMTAADKLQSKLGHISSGTTFTDMERDSARVSFASLTAAIDGIGSHMTTMSTAVGVAIGGLASQVAQKGVAMVKSLALDPIIGGFQEYQTNLNSIQTILSNTADSGGNLKTVNSALQQLNKYSDQTIFNFSEMARNIGTFTAAGVHLQPAVSAIKGIANLAALSGSNSQQASTAMYQLSQAIAAGKVGLQDWNSVVNAGMGGAVFQKALLRTGQNMGTIAKGAVKIDKATGKATINGKSFRESLTAKPGEQSWLTSDVLTKTLSQFTGDLSDAKLAAQGFSAEEIKAIQQTAKNAKAAATQVKSLPQLFDVAKESLGSGWSATFQTIFGNFTQAKTTFTALSNTINGFINTNSNARNKVLKDWAALGGRTVLIDGIKNAFKALMDIVKPIHDAFRNIFPRQTGKDLFELTTKFRDLMKRLQASPATMDKIKRTFSGFFAVLHIGWTIVKDVAHVLESLSGVAGKGAGGILSFTSRVGDFLIALDKAISKGGSFKDVFHALSNVLKGPAHLISGIANAIKNLFTGAGTGGAEKLTGAVGTLRKALGPLGGILDTASKAWDGFLRVLKKVKTAVSPMLTDVAHVFSNFGKIVADGIKNADYSAVFGAINTVLVGGIFLAIKKALGGGINIDLGGGVLKSLNTTLSTLTGNLKALQKNIQAHTLLAIAAAIAVLAAGIALLSLIDPKKLTTALTAVAIGMGELVASIAILNTAVKGAGFIKMPFIAASLVILAGSLIVLAGAMKIFASMSWEELAKGLVGVGVSLGAIGAATQLMNGPKLIATGAALLPLAVAINVLAVAVKIFATMSWEQLAKGLGGVSVGLAGIGLALKLMPPGLPLTGVGLIAVSSGLVILAGAVSAFGHMNLGTLAKGIGGIGASLVVIGFAIDAIPPGMAARAAAVLVLAVAMTSLSAAISIFGNMQLTTLAQGIIGMGTALVELGIGLDSMSTTIPGSIALLAAAGALALLVPTIGLLGAMPWGVIFKGLAAIAATLAVLAVVGGLASAPLLALGVAVLALGIGLAAVGGAVYLFAKGLSLLSDTSVKAVTAMMAAATLFIAAFPAMVVKFVKGMTEVLAQVVVIAPQIIAALVKIATDLLDAIIKLSPKIAQAVGALVTEIINVLNQNAGPILAAGLALLVTLLSGLSNNIGKVTEKAVLIVARFLGALANNMPKLIGAGAKLLVNFATGLTRKIPTIVPVVAKLIATFVNNVAKRLPQIIGAAGNLVASFIRSIANQVPKIISAGTNIIVKFLQGIGNAIPRIVSAAVNVATKFVNALSHGLVRLVNAGFRAIIDFLNGVARAIRRNSDAMFNAGWNVANAIMDGMLNGLSKLAGKVIHKAIDIAKSIPGKFLSILGIGSPSKVMMEIGKFTMQGLAAGLDKGVAGVDRSMTSAANGVTNSAKVAFSKIPAALDGVIDMEPVITPILDLANVKAGASQLGSLLAVPAVGVVSTVQASAISTDQQAATAASVVPVPATTFSFEQNNYSPDPLSNIELYRQTNNQLSRYKSLVGVK